MASGARWTLARACLVLLLAWLPTLPPVAPPALAQSFPGGFLEAASSLATRPRLSAAQLAALLPARGKFVFPAPYHTEAIRLTNASDCGGSDCVWYVGYSYYRNINNHVGSDTMYIFLGLNRGRGGAGPTLFSYNKVTDALTKVGPLFDASSPLSWNSGEGWYFSATVPTKLYLNDGPRMRRYDVLSKTFETVFDVSTQFGADRYIWQLHSSDDDRVHSATLRATSTGEMLGCVAYAEVTRRLDYYPRVGAFDECHIDKSGRWLLSLEDIDGQYGLEMRIFDLQTNTETRIWDQDGAVGHADMGHGYVVGADNWHPLPNATRLWKFPITDLSAPVVHHNPNWSTAAANHIAHGNAKPGLPPEQQYACGSNMDGALSRANEIVCFRLDGSLQVLVVGQVMTDPNASGGGDSYAQAPKGNLDVTGRYFIWTSNMGGSRLDAFLVKVPGHLLTGGTGDTTPPTVALTAPLSGASLAGLVAVVATASDNVGVAGVQFKVDGANLGAERPTAPYTVSWNTSLLANGPHTLTAVARDAAGNTATAGAVTVTVGNLLDTTPPGIAAVTAGALTASGATIAWTTNEASDTQVEYGLTTAYGSATGLHTSLVTSHAQALSGLTAGTLYHYRVKSRDAAGNLATSGDFTFTTLGVPSLGPVAAYAFDEGSGPTTADLSGHQNPATLAGALWSPVARFGQALAFTGANSYVEAPDQDFLTLGTAATLAAWVRLDSAPSEVVSVVNKWSQTAEDELLFGITPNRTLYFAWQTSGGGAWGTPAFNDASGTGVVPLGTWTHIALVRSGATLTFYLNGQPEAPRSAFDTVAFRNGSNALRLGGQGRGGANRFFPGLLDEVRVYNRALSPADLQSVMATPLGALADATPPTVTLTAPAGGTPVSGTITVTATAADNVGVAGVQFKLDGAPLGAEDTASPYSVPWNTTTVGNGSHTLTAVARDAAGNVTVSKPVTVSVSSNTPAIDSTPPVISAVVASDVTGSGAIIAWTSDKASDSQVEYGLTSAYGSMTPLDPSRVTAHSQPLSGLAASMVYHYRVKSRDAAGNLAVSGDFTFATLAAPDPATSLAGWWRFDEGSGLTAGDASGNGHAGTLLNGPTWTAGRLATALAFDGLDDAVRVPHASALNAYPLTVAVWIKTDTTAGVRGIVNKYVARSYNGYQVFMDTGHLCAWYLRDTANYVYDGGGCTMRTAGVNDNQWHHVAFVVDAQGGRLYVDGVEKARQPWTGTAGPPSTSQPLHLGYYPGAFGGAEYFAGLLDDVQLYTRALSAEEVAGLSSTAGPDTDITPPTPFAMAASLITDSGATITWATDEPADSQVEYGLTPAYGSATPLDSSQVTAHSQPLSGLAAGTVYHYRVKSKDAAGNLAVSGDLTFTTADLSQPTVALTDPAAGATVAGTITVRASASDNVGIVGVQFQLDGTPLGAELTLSPYVFSWNTATVPNGAHTLTAVARDAAGNRTTSALVTVTVQNDTTPPVISGVAVAATSASGASITWTTDEASDSQVEYGLTPAYGSVAPLDGSMVTAHSQTLSGLAAGRMYHYRVKSRDAAGNLATSASGRFKTSDATPPTVAITEPAAGATVAGTITVRASASDNVGIAGVQFQLDGTPLGAELTLSPYVLSWDTATVPNGAHTLTAVARDAAGNSSISNEVTVTVQSDTTPPVISAVAASAISSSGAAITWTTDEASDSQVEYGLTPAYGSVAPLNPSRVTAHSEPLSGLSANTLYHYRVKSKDAAGNLAVSAEATFTTLPAGSP